MGRPKRNVRAAGEETLTPPSSLTPTQSIVRVIKPEGNNLYTCALPGGQDAPPLLLELAQRFRNTIWIKRGGFVLAERYVEKGEETRAEGEIVNVVGDERAWRKQHYWPKEFSKEVQGGSDSEEESNMGKMPPSDSEDE